MENNFKELLASMLAELDNGKPVDEIIADKMKEANLSEKSQSNVREAVDYVGQLENARQSLTTACERGSSREEWLESRIDDHIQSLPENLQEDANKVLDKAADKYFENIDQE